MGGWGGNPHGQSRFSRKCARVGIKINNSDDTIVLLINRRITITLSGDGNVTLKCKLWSCCPSVAVLEGEQVRKCATVAKPLCKAHPTVGCLLSYLFAGRLCFSLCRLFTLAPSLKKLYDLISPAGIRIAYTSHPRLSCASWRTARITRL